MKKLDKKQEEELLSKKNCLFHFIIYEGTLKDNRKQITTVTMATDEGEKTEEEMRERILEWNINLKEVEILTLFITPNKNIVDHFFRLFKMNFSEKGVNKDRCTNFFANLSPIQNN